MGRVALTEAQRRDREAISISSEILKRLNVKRGEMEMNKRDFGYFLGVNPSTWRRYRTCSLEGVSFRLLLDMLQRVGLTLVVMTPDEAKKWRSRNDSS